MVLLNHSLKPGDKQSNITKPVALPEMVYDTLQIYRFKAPLFPEKA